MQEQDLRTTIFFKGQKNASSKTGHEFENDYELRVRRRKKFKAIQKVEGWSKKQFKDANPAQIRRKSGANLAPARTHAFEAKTEAETEAVDPERRLHFREE